MFSGHCMLGKLAVLLSALVLACQASIVESVSIRGTDLRVKLATQVGAELDARAIATDVRRLWETGRFDDIQVETTGTAVVFRVIEAPPLRLRKILIEPSSFGLQPKVPEGALLSRFRAHEIALEAQKQLEARGYLD